MAQVCLSSLVRGVETYEKKSESALRVIQHLFQVAQSLEIDQTAKDLLESWKISVVNVVDLAAFPKFTFTFVKIVKVLLGLYEEGLSKKGAFKLFRKVVRLSKEGLKIILMLPVLHALGTLFKASRAALRAVKEVASLSHVSSWTAKDGLRVLKAISSLAVIVLTYVSYFALNSLYGSLFLLVPPLITLINTFCFEKKITPVL